MSSMIKPTKLTFKKVEAEWYNYHNTLQEIAKLREEIMNPFKETDTNVGGGNGNSISSPTEQIATRLTTHKQLNYLCEVAETIDNIYKGLPEDYKKLVRLRYWSNRNLTWKGIGDELHISDRQARRWRDAIVISTVKELGWR